MPGGGADVRKQTTAQRLSVPAFVSRSLKANWNGTPVCFYREKRRPMKLSGRLMTRSTRSAKHFDAVFHKRCPVILGRVSLELYSIHTRYSRMKMFCATVHCTYMHMENEGISYCTFMYIVNRVCKF